MFVNNYSRLSLSRIPRDPLKYFEVSEPRHSVCRTEEKIIRTTTFNKYICNWTLEVRDILKYCGKEEKLLLKSSFSSFPQYFLDFHV